MLNFEAFVTLMLTLEMWIRSYGIYCSSNSTYRPNFVQIGKYCGQMDINETKIWL